MEFNYGPLGLLILQGSPFCNINCGYCYLPDRSNKLRMKLDVIETTLKNLLHDNLIKEKLTIVWHAGEPLVIPLNYYMEIFDLIRKIIPDSIVIQHHIQTNATLINQQWCDFFIKYNIRIGISIDGPEEINDYKRLTRKGKGTFEKIIYGINKLKKNNIPFHAIAVITDISLENPENIFRFFCQLGIDRLGFNIDEIEGINSVSSLKNDKITRQKFYIFFKTIYDLYKRVKPSFTIREFDEAENKLFYLPHDFYELQPLTQLTKPFGIITVDTEGNFSTFSPELLGQKSDLYENFILGNIYSTKFVEVLSTNKFQKLFNDIKAGIKLCQEECSFFSVCGGGTPSNKFFENGSFISKETLHCRYSVQVPFEVVLNYHESIVEKVEY